MTTTSRPLASLSPGLLARKGSARPAMRPQLQPLRQFHEATARQIDDDLGWNDMGHEPAKPAPPAIVAEPAADSERDEPSTVVPFSAAEPAAAADVPEVVRARVQAAERIAAAAPRRSALAEGRRAAFTLRLDAERHLKLRLACVVANRSAQQLVTEALDALIAGMSEIDSLSEQVRKRG